MYTPKARLHMPRRVCVCEGCACIHVCVGAGAHGCVRDRVFAGVYAHMGIGAELEYCNI